MNWYYAEQGQQIGPVSEAQLDELARQGVVHPLTLVWAQGMGEWQPYQLARALGGPACVMCGRAAPQSESVTLDGRVLCCRCKDVYVERQREEGTFRPRGSMQYAGFWIRFVARMADSCVLGVVQVLLTLIVSLALHKGRLASDPTETLVIFGFAAFGRIAIGFVYQTWMLARYGATLGKMMCHLKVVRADSSKLDFGLAAARYFGELLSSTIVQIGNLMAAFDKEHRALHDRIVGTRVIYFTGDEPDLAAPPTDSADAANPAVVVCARCGAPVERELWNGPVAVPCQACGAAVSASVFPAVSRPWPDAAPQFVVEGEGQASCFHHAGNLASVNCSQCGRYLCRVCELDCGAGRILCPSCRDRNLKQGAPEFVEHRTLYDSIAFAAALIPNLLIFTIYFTFFTAPAVIGFAIWSWRRPLGLVRTSRWRYWTAILIAGGNIAFIVLVIGAIFAARKS